MGESRHRRSRDGTGWHPAVAGLLALACVAATACDSDLVRRNGPAGGRAEAPVDRVVDGDTVVLGGVGKARLIGVDTPEVYGRQECFGREASEFAKRVLSHRRVRYRLGVEPRDRYGRALVYLWLEDGRFFNGMLVQRGFAVPLTIQPNVEYAERFVALSREARRKQRGFWATDACP